VNAFFDPHNSDRRNPMKLGITSANCGVYPLYKKTLPRDPQGSGATRLDGRRSEDPEQTNKPYKDGGGWAILKCEQTGAMGIFILCSHSTDITNVGLAPTGAHDRHAPIVPRDRHRQVALAAQRSCFSLRAKIATLRHRPRARARSELIVSGRVFAQKVRMPEESKNLTY
jgi:hypothetical protein